MFKNLDTDKSGTLNKQEIQRGFQNLKNELNKSFDKRVSSRSTKEYDELWNSMDRDGDGVISYEEFIAAAINKAELVTKKNIENAFKLIDEDGSGYISPEELKKAFASNASKSEDLIG